MKYWPELPHKCGRGLLGTAVFVCAMLMAQGRGAAQNPAGSNDDEAAFRRVSNRLLCQCGCGYMVLSCNHVDCNSATFIRRTIHTSLAAGKGEDAIVTGFVEQYGPRILPEPPKKGFSLTAWLMPFVGLLLGTALVSFVLWQWKHRVAVAEVAEGGSIPEASPAKEPSPARDTALVEKYRAQIDRDLENE